MTPLFFVSSDLDTLKSAGQLFVEYPFIGACFFPHIGLNHLLLWSLSNGGFSNSPSSLSVQSFVSVWIRGILFYSARYSPLLLLVLTLKLSQTWPKRTPSGCLPCSLDVSLSCVDSSLLLSGTARCSVFISYFLSPGISHFSTEPQFLQWEVVFRNQDLGSRVATLSHCTSLPVINLDVHSFISDRMYLRDKDQEIRLLGQKLSWQILPNCHSILYGEILFWECCLITYCNSVVIPW